MELLGKAIAAGATPADVKQAFRLIKTGRPVGELTLPTGKTG
jgi:hypothetical protein